MIQGKVPREHSTTLLPVARAIEDARTILVVEASNALPLLRPQPGRQSVVLTQMRMLSAQMLGNVRPDAVIAPLIAAAWDIVDLGVTLQDMGYRGDLFALTRPLPRAELVLREVSAVCPRLTVRLLELA